MRSVDDLFAKFGGMALFSEATGIKYNTAASLKSRGTIPLEYWKAIEARAVRLKIEGVDRYTLLDMLIAKHGKPEALKPAVANQLKKKIAAALSA